MSNFFRVGDVCILQNCEVYHDLNGLEVTVIKPLQMVDIKYPDGSTKELACYTVDIELPDGSICCPAPYQLRLKDEPRDIEAWALLKVANVIADAIINALPKIFLAKTRFLGTIIVFSVSGIDEKIEANRILFSGFEAQLARHKESRILLAFCFSEPYSIR